MLNFIVEQTPNEVKFENMSLEGITFILDGLSISEPHSGVLHIPLWEEDSITTRYSWAYRSGLLAQLVMDCPNPLQN